MSYRIESYCISSHLSSLFLTKTFMASWFHVTYQKMKPAHRFAEDVMAEETKRLKEVLMEDKMRVIEQETKPGNLQKCSKSDLTSTPVGGATKLKIVTFLLCYFYIH